MATLFTIPSESPLVLGDTQNSSDPYGIAIAALGCADGPVHLGYMEFLSSSPAPPCCEYPIVKAPVDSYPGVEGPIMVLCSDPGEVVGVFVDSVINPEPNCSCEEAQTLPVESETWGSIKALYK